MNFFLNKIDKQWENHRSLDQNMNDLKRKLVDLNALKEDTKSRMKAELRPRKKLKKEVHLWLENVGRINGEIQKHEQGVTESCVVLRGSYNENVLKKMQEVQELRQQGEFDQGLVVDDLTWIGQALSTTTLFGKVAETCIREIWGYLMDDDIRKIGVWGMGGIGKTTIMKFINNQLLKETGKFNIVIWITVSKEMNILRIQKGIAHAMEEKKPLEDEDETIRAGKLYELLTRKGKYVLILDDLWDKLSLEEVGIPEPSNGSKLVVTTRKLDVCRYLDCQEVRVPILPKQDALSLFSEKVGRDVLDDPDLSPTVEAVVEQCAGLPLAIVTVASTLKGERNIYEWKNALIELNRRAESVNNFDEKVLQPLRFSYDRLENKRVQQCFLHCALWPEDHEIWTNKLIEFWIAEGLVEELETMEQEIDRGHTILNKLISNCLLEKVDGRSCVNLHDLVRDMALDIIIRGKSRFLVKAGMQLKEIPDFKEWAEDLDKVSLCWNQGMKIPPQVPPPKCHVLTTLLLSNCGITSIPECFFEHMHGLKILDLSSNLIQSLPSSISDLETLTALLLRYCYDLKNIPSLSKLQALKKLDLGFTGIWNLPHGMERLVKLKYLSLCDTRIEKVPDGILSKFSCLQHLEVHDKIKGERIQRVVRGDELGGLRMLEIFCGRFRDLKALSNYVQALHGRTQGPRKYDICVGYENFCRSSMYDKCIKLNHCQIYRNGAKFPSSIQQLTIEECSFEFCEELLFSQFIPVPHATFSALTYINIIGCKKIKKLFSSDWVLKNLQKLKVLYVADCDKMEEIIASASELEEEGMDTSNTLNLALPKLKELSLSRLPKLKSIYSAKGVIVCDSLQTVRITNCPELKRIFSLSLPKIINRQMESNSKIFSESQSEQLYNSISCLFLPFF